MVTKGSVRRKNKAVFQEVITLRKKGHSYSEISKKTRVAKTTINNWLHLSGLTLDKNHLLIQVRKRMENFELGTEASRITRKRKKEKDINEFIQIQKKYFNDPLYNFGIALFESEGGKATDCKFSNSDYRVLEAFIRFIEKYISKNRNENMTFSLYIHETRKHDIDKILNYWAKKIGIKKEKVLIYWKKNIVKHRRLNSDYNGQLVVRVKGESILGSKLLAVSDIILKKYLR